MPYVKLETIANILSTPSFDDLVTAKLQLISSSSEKKPRKSKATATPTEDEASDQKEKQKSSDGQDDELKGKIAANIRRDKLRDLGLFEGNMQAAKAWLGANLSEANLQFLFPDDPAQPSREAAPQIEDRAEYKAALESLKRYYPGKNLDGFAKIFLACSYVDQVIDESQARESADRALKIAVLFASFDGDKLDVAKTLKDFDGFLTKSFNSERGTRTAAQQQDLHFDLKTKKLHDICAKFTLPTAGPNFTPQGWKNLLIDRNEALGKAAFEAISNAASIQATLGKVPESAKQIHEALMAMTYPRARENTEFARLCQFYKIPVAQFNETLDLMKQDQPLSPEKFGQAGTELPDVSVSFDEGGKKYMMVKLPASDLRATILGNITSCCQHIDGNAERCVIDGMTLPTNGFYVVLECPKDAPQQIPWNNLEQSGFQIVGQGYAYKTIRGNLTLDSFEKARDSHVPVCQRALELFAQKIIATHPEIYRVTVGTGSGIMSNSNKERIGYPELQKLGKPYGDAKEQVSILTRFENVETITQFHKDFLEAVIKEKPQQSLKTLFSSTDPSGFISALAWSQGMSIDEALTIQKSRNLKVFLSSNAATAYNAGASVEALVQLPEMKLSLLTSDKACHLYRNGVQFNSLSTVPFIEKLELLLQCKYGEPGPTFDQLNRIDDLKRLEILVRTDYYHPNRPTFKDLSEESDLTRLSLLAWASYNSDFTFQQLKTVTDIAQLEALAQISQRFKAWTFTEHSNPPTFEELVSIGTEKLVALSSYQPYSSCTFADLASIPDIDRLKFLTSEEAKPLWQFGVKFQEISEVQSIEELKLIAKRIPSLHNLGYKITVDILRDKEKYDLLTSTEAKSILTKLVGWQPFFQEDISKDELKAILNKADTYKNLNWDTLPTQIRTDLSAYRAQKDSVQSQQGAESTIGHHTTAELSRKGTPPRDRSTL